MARTRTAPWDYNRNRGIPTTQQLREDNVYLRYWLLKSELQRNFGIDYITNIIEAWGDINYQEKLDRARVLEYELTTCLCDETPDRERTCLACRTKQRNRYGDGIPFLKEEL